VNARLKLRLHDAAFQGDLLVLSRPGTQSQVRLPGEKHAWLPFLDGRHDLRGFMAALLARDACLSFREVLGTLKLLELGGFLVEPLGLAETDADDPDSLKRWGDTQTRGFSPEALPAPEGSTLLNAFASVGFFDDFAPELLEFLASQGELREYKAGSFIIRQEDDARDLYLMLDGSVSVYKRKANGVRSRICVLQGPTVFGEAALRTVTRRSADVYARSDCRLFCLSREAFQVCVQRFAPQFERSSFFDKIFVSQYLSTTPLFREIPPEALGVFIREGRMIRYGAGQDVFREGDLGDAFYLIVRGSMSVLRAGQAEPITLAQGDCFGEIALFSQVPRTATLRSNDDSAVLRLEAPAFWRILLENLGLALHMEELAERRGAGETLTLT
jgi:CRP-like cAMP-binding protein